MQRIKHTMKNDMQRAPQGTVAKYARHTNVLLTTCVFLLLLIQGLARMSPAPGGSSSSSMPAYVLDALQADSSSSSLSTPRHLATTTAAAAGGPSGTAGASGTVGDLVSCLMMLDALDDANMYLLLHARAGVRQLILRCVV
jgi:hypothetical protein